LNTVITEKTDNGEISYDVFSKLVDSRILFLYGFITDEIAMDVVATLFYLDHQDDKKTISLYINSEGGDIRSIFMIYDIMKMIGSPIETFCTGTAMHESALILAAGTKGKRYATKSSVICVNQLGHFGSTRADLAGAEILLKESKKDNKKFVQALTSCVGKSYKSVLKDSEREFYMNPSAAKRYGIIDSIIGDNNEKSKK
jgi:ATP-dependent Clp protease protease subunit